MGVFTRTKTPKHETKYSIDRSPPVLIIYLHTIGHDKRAAGRKGATFRRLRTDQAENDAPGWFSDVYKVLHFTMR